MSPSPPQAHPRLRIVADDGARPKHSSTDIELSLPAEPPAVAALRHVARTFAGRFAVSAATLDELTLAVSEAVTNVVVHAYRDRRHPGPVCLRGEADARQVTLTVTDRGRGMAPRDDSPGLGLGVPLMRACSDGLVVVSDEHGTMVCMTFHLLPKRDGAGR